MQIELSSRGLLGVLFRHLTRIMIIFLFCLGAGIIYLQTAKPQYESVGSLLVKFGRDAQPDVAVNHSMPTELAQNDRREIIQSNTQILRSRDLLRPLVVDITVAKLYPDIAAKLKPGESGVETAITRLQRDDLIVKVGLQSDILEVRMQNENPEVATDFLRRLFDSYITHRSNVYSKPQTDFLAEQVQQASERLHNSQRALQDYKAQVGISSIEEELKQLLREKADAGIVALQALDKAKARLEELETEEATMLATYNSDAPAVIRLRKSIAEARSQVAMRQQDAKAARESDGTGALISAQVARIDKRIKTLEAVRVHHADLERQVQIDEEDYKNYLARAETARINESLNEQKVTRVVVIDTPMVPDRPARPRKLLVLLMALAAGTILGLGAALLKETMDDRFTTPAQLGHTLELPVLASFFKPAKG